MRAWVKGHVVGKCPILKPVVAALHQLRVATWG